MQKGIGKRRRNFSLAVGAGLLCASGMAAAQTATPLKSGIWWIPAETGWGLYTVDQGNAIAPTWYTFDADGEPVWYLIPGAFPDSSGVYRGEVYRFTGTPLQNINGPAIQNSSKVGDAVFTFGSDGKLRFDYTIGATTQSKLLEKYPLPKDIVCSASPTTSRASATNYSDLWYDQGTDGWGLNLTHVDDSLMIVTWYTYDDDNEPVFYTGLLAQDSPGNFSGKIYRERAGVPLAQISGNPASTGSDEVGTLSIAFSNGETGAFTYTVKGVTQTKPIKRLQFGSTAAVCEAKALGGGGGGGGTPGADECYPPLAVGDRYRIRSTQDGEIGETDVEVIGTGTYEGHPVFRIRYRPVGQGTAGEVIEFVEQTATERIYYGSEGFIPEVNAQGTTRFNPPVRVPRATPVGASGRLLYEAITNYTANGQSVSSTIDFDETYHRVGTETQSSPAGTFAGACKFDVTLDSDISITTAGFTVRTQVESSAVQWAHPDIGGFRGTTTSTTTVNTTGAPVPIPPTVTNASSLSEIVSAVIGGRSYP